MDISNGTLESGPHVGAPTVWLLSFLSKLIDHWWLGQGLQKIVNCCVV